MTQRFMLKCWDWKDDGFDDPNNVTEREGEVDDKKTSDSSLFYKFMLRKNGITMPIAEGGSSGLFSLWYNQVLVQVKTKVSNSRFVRLLLFVQRLGDQTIVFRK